MKAARLHRYSHDINENFKIDEIERPKIGANEILMKVNSFGLNYADVMAFKGYYKAAPPNPAVLGYDAIGTVVECGEAVKNFKLGDKLLALTRFGAFAEYCIVNPMAAVKVEESEDEAALLSLATQGATAYHMFQHLTQIIPTKPYKILIYAAAGGLGRILISLAKKHKNIEIYGLCSNDEKVKELASMGVTPINYVKEPDFRDHLTKDQIKFDYIFNSVGGSSLKLDYELLKVNGLLLLYGVAALSNKKKNMLNVLKTIWQTGFKSPLFMMGKSKGIYGVNMLQIADHEPAVLTAAMQGIYEKFKSGDLKIKTDKVFVASDINNAIKYLASGKSKGKVTCTWNNN